MIHRFIWFERTCACGAMTVPEPAMRSRRNQWNNGSPAQRAAKRAAELAEAERKLAAGAPTKGAAPRSGPLVTAKRGRPASRV